MQINSWRQTGLSGMLPAGRGHGAGWALVGCAMPWAGGMSHLVQEC